MTECQFGPIIFHVRRSKTRPSRQMADGVMSSLYNIDDDDDAEGSYLAEAALKFADDFAEFQARADSGGSTFGVFRRHAFAQHSLRQPSTDPEVVVPQRRAHSLVPPVMTPPDGSGSSGDAAAAAAAADQKMLIAVICDQSQCTQQQRRHRYHEHHHHHKHQHHCQQSEQSGSVKMDTLQVCFIYSVLT